MRVLKKPADLTSEDFVGLDEDTQRLFSYLHIDIQKQALPHLAGLEDIFLQVGSALGLKVGPKHVECDEVTVTQQHVNYLSFRLQHGIRHDGRAGISQTFHRLAFERDLSDTYNMVTIRVGRYVERAAEPIRDVLINKSDSLMLIGRPGVGKSTVLRGAIPILYERYGFGLCVVDTSGDVTGDGKIMHPQFSNKLFKRFQVPDPRLQHEVLHRMTINHTPLVCVVDEISKLNEVEAVNEARNKGVRLVSTVHGDNLSDVFRRPVNRALLGDLDIQAGLRRNEPVFESAIEIRNRGEFWFHPDLARSIDNILVGKAPVVEEIKA